MGTGSGGSAAGDRGDRGGKSDSKFFTAMMEDAAELCERRSSPVFTDFLTETEQAAAAAVMRRVDANYLLYGGYPDVAISGFHMMKKHGYSDEDITMIIDTALALRKLDTVFYTGHCTGVEPFNAMKKLMGDQLHYVHCGDEIRIRTTIERIMWNTVHSTDSGKQEEAPKYRMKDSVASKTSQKRREYMKWHKFFAWGTVVCFVMTMVTGYKRK